MVSTEFVMIAAAAWIGFVFTQIAVERYGLYRQGFILKARARFEGLFLSESLAMQLMTMKWLGSFVGACGVGFFLRDTPGVVVCCGALVGAIAGFFLPDLYPVYLRWQRLKRLDQQLPDAMITLSSCLRSGLGLGQAMQFLVNQMPPPIAQEFGLVVKETQVGVSLNKALENMAQRINSRDLSIFVTAVTISREVGGNLIELFDTLATTIRERMTMEGKIKALTAQGKMQTLVVGILPFALAYAINWMHPELMANLTGTMIGWVLIGIACVWEAIGLLLIYKIVTIEV